MYSLSPGTVKGMNFTYISVYTGRRINGRVNKSIKSNESYYKSIKELKEVK